MESFNLRKIFFLWLLMGIILQGYTEIFSSVAASSDPHPKDLQRPLAHTDAERIFGGRNAYPGEFPYQVAILKAGNFLCSGAILNSKWVITAAHCLDPEFPEIYTIQVGVLDSQGDTGEEYSVEEIFNHPDCQRELILNDISLLRIQKSFIFSNLVAPVSLSSRINVSDAIATISGWGATGSLEGSSKILKMATVKIKNDCSSVITNLGDDGKKILCAFGVTGAQCVGDSGGPLTVDGALTGIISTGLSQDLCNSIVGRPVATYTRISYFLEWIHEIMSSHNE